MADTSGQAEIRGIDIDKLVKGFAEELFIFKQFVNQTSTSAREIRWYSQTSTVLTGTTTTGITKNLISNVSQLSSPTLVEKSWTRNTSYVRKYFVESPIISDEDVKDSDIDVLAQNLRQLTRSIASAVDVRIWNVLTENTGESTTLHTIPVNANYSVAVAQWSDLTNGNPIRDILSGAAAIRAQGYDIADMVLLMNAASYKNLLTNLITVKGSSIPAFSSEKVGSGVLMNILGHRVVVSQNVTPGYIAQFPNKASATWKSFTPITARTVEEVGIGTKIRVWEEGEAILTDPKSVHLLSGCGTT